MLLKDVVLLVLASKCNAFVIGFPGGGGGPRADVGEYGDFATNFSPCGGGNVGT